MSHLSDDLVKKLPASAELKDEVEMLAVLKDLLQVDHVWVHVQDSVNSHSLKKCIMCCHPNLWLGGPGQYFASIDLSSFLWSVGK